MYLIKLQDVKIWIKDEKAMRTDVKAKALCWQNKQTADKALEEFVKSGKILEGAWEVESVLTTEVKEDYNSEGTYFSKKKDK